MLILIRGKNSSGKSAAAESLTARLIPRRYYLATMNPIGASGLSRVLRHRRQRAGLGFITLETPYDIRSAGIEYDSAALLEDVSNLLANTIFELSGTEDDVFGNIMDLCSRVKHAVIVTISEFGAEDFGETEPDEGTLEFVRALYRLNERLAEQADAVVETRGGEQIIIKGGIYA